MGSQELDTTWRLNHHHHLKMLHTSESFGKVKKNQNSRDLCNNMQQYTSYFIESSPGRGKQLARGDYTQRSLLKKVLFAYINRK